MMSLPTELDYVVNMGRKIDSVLGIKMTGAGFGGCTVAIIKSDAVDNFIERIGALGSVRNFL